MLALQNEVRPFGITVCAVMPGDIASGFTDARKKSDAGDDVYAGRIERSVAVMEKDERGGMTPAYAGAYVAKMALKTRSKPLVALGTAYKGAAVLAKLLPRRLSNWIVGLIYAPNPPPPRGGSAPIQLSFPPPGHGHLKSGQPA